MHLFYLIGHQATICDIDSLDNLLMSLFFACANQLIYAYLACTAFGKYPYRNNLMLFYAFSVKGPGDVSFWEFSGFEPYYISYDHFVGEHHCIHMVVVNMNDTSQERVKQLHFWLNFIRSHMSPTEPIGRNLTFNSINSTYLYKCLNCSLITAIIMTFLT